MSIQEQLEVLKSALNIVLFVSLPAIIIGWYTVAKWVLGKADLIAEDARATRRFKEIYRYERGDDRV
ncbi:hypothetical protein [Arthrobacter sp. KNU40]|uniref:hypothetical protein n=1 Tax=Arthrobacter sp. KNU40 TaxID=3447965 RepID=UPI003F60FBB5